MVNIWLQSPHETFRRRRPSASRRPRAAMACRADDQTGDGHHRSHRPDLRHFRLPLAAERSLLVPGVGRGDGNGLARRYHWRSAAVRDFVAEPHTAIVGENQGTIMNLVDAQAKPAQTALLDIAHENPETTLKTARHLRLPRHHEVLAENVDLKR